MLTRKLAVLAAVIVLAAVSVFIMWLLDWNQKGTLGLDIDLWLIAWFLALTAYWGLPNTEGLRVANKLVGTVLFLALGLGFTYLFKYATPSIVGGSVDEYPLMSLTYVAWVLVFIMLFIWLRNFIRGL
ncbi:MAG: hypothetical protein M5U22_02660 [Thermoleophilia bacterium]|nr:hypothetical protein [Thermoleophilia bacterium]